MPVKATKLGPGKLTLTDTGDTHTATDFAGQCTKVTWEPDYKTEEPIEVLSGESYAEPGKFNSKLAGEMLQDFGAGSLLKFCYDHAGETFNFEFIPATAGKLKMSGQLQVSPVGIGGDVGKANTIGFEFTCVGKPALTEDYAA